MRLSTVAFALAVAVILSGCSRTPLLPYHSTASIPHYTSTQMTAMTFIDGDPDMRKGRHYAVIAAVDDNDVHYILVAPKRSNVVAARNLNEVNVMRGAPLSVARVAQLIEGLNGVANTWDRNLSPEAGYFFEFYHAPEQDIVRVSENVVEWSPAFRFNYNHTEKGPAALLILGGGDTVNYSITIDNRKKVEDFRNLLQAGLSRLQASPNLSSP